MNVKDLIQQIKLKPERYVGEYNLEKIQCFISGFLYSNISANIADVVDLSFKKQFHQWAKTNLETEWNIKFDMQRNYVFYITQLYENEEQRVQFFFNYVRIFYEFRREFKVRLLNSGHSLYIHYPTYRPGRQTAAAGLQCIRQTRV